MTKNWKTWSTGMVCTMIAFAGMIMGSNSKSPLWLMTLDWITAIIFGVTALSLFEQVAKPAKKKKKK